MTLLVTTIAALAAHTGFDSTVKPWRPHHHRPPPMRRAVASWYAEHGPGACGVDDVQNGYRIANRTLRCGTRVLICFRRCVTTEVADRGPFVYSRLFDLNANTRYATGCPDLCSVRWRLR